MGDASKRIDLAAPLLSVRRHGGAAGAEATGTPCCAADDATPGGVPFGWEHRPGHPKSVRTTRRALQLAAAPDEAVAVVAAALPVPQAAERYFSDALSLVDSCFTVNCSVTGLSDAGAPAGVPSAACGSVMMDRFLSAAKAVAVGSSHQHYTFPKASAVAAASIGTSTQERPRPAPANARARDRGSLPRRLPVQHSPANHVPSSNHAKDVYDDDEWEVHSTAGFASKRCGMLPTRCVKSTLLLLNPAQTTRRSGGGGARRGRGRPPFLSKSGGSKRELAPLLRLPRNDGQHLEHDASMGVPQQTWEEVYINSLLRSDRGCLMPGTLTTELGRTVRELYTNRAGVHPKATHLGLLLVLDRNDEYHDHHCLSAKDFPEAGETASLLPPKSTRPAKAKANGGKKSRRNARHDFPPVLEDKTAASRDIVLWTRSLLPLPPPKSPSESWLSRALPSVSSKPPVTSFLGIHVQQPRRQNPSPWCSSDQAKVVDHARPRQIRIYDLQK